MAEQADARAEPAPSASYVYALGRVQPRFPSLGLEKEFAQATGRTERAEDLTDRQVVEAVLRDNLYIARQMCWVMTIEGLDSYILTPRYPDDIELLLDATRPAPRATDIDVVIGVQGPIAPPTACNGLTVPIVVFDQMYSFDVDSLVKALPAPKGVRRDAFEPTAEELFARLIQIADNTGATDADRALNYVAVRYDAVYTLAADMHARDFSLTSVDVRPSPLSSMRTIVDVVFTYTHRQTDVVEKWSARIDVTEEFPFLVAKLSPTIGH
jgi:PatG C-terminal